MKSMLPRFRTLLFCLAIAGLAFADLTQTEKVDIAPVWAGHPVAFDIRNAGEFQFVAYYDTLRRMTVAKRTLGSTVWSRYILPTTTGWDSHNYIAMAIDDSGYIHISGNMHNVALIYLRSTRPYDITAFTSPGMVGTNETSVTYPVFIKGPNGKLIFQYRDGGSGSGNTLWNNYNLTTKKWTRIGSTVLSGGGTVNAYPSTPILGPDGYFHIIWMWRETPVANTNHDLSHMKSLDLATWYTMSGTRLTLPVTMTTPGVVVDPVPSGNGLINMDFWISWDILDRAVVTYHKYAISGKDTCSQIFNTRYETNGWKIYQTSGWTGYKWPLDLEGSLARTIAATPLETDASGKLLQYYIYKNDIKRQWDLDEATLRPIRDSVWVPPAAMKPFYTVETAWTGSPALQINEQRLGEYYLRWESLPQNQDLARSSYPGSSMLRVYRFSNATAVRPGPVKTGKALSGKSPGGREDAVDFLGRHLPPVGGISAPGVILTPSGSKAHRGTLR